jgi:predicted deacylase
VPRVRDLPVTGYKIYERYKTCSLDGLNDRSRRPYRHANKLPYQVERTILRIKNDHSSWAAGRTLRARSGPHRAKQPDARTATSRHAPAMSTPRIRWLTCFLLLAPALAAAEDGPWGPFRILEVDVEPGTKEQLSFVRNDSYLKDAIDLPVLIARGTKPGPTLCLTAAVHGDEVNGVEIARSVYEGTDVGTLTGTLISMPMVNVWGFRSGNRYLADRRDLNRAFPGNRRGSTASRISYHVFEVVIRRCDYLVDLHTGSHARTNLPQIRVDLENEAAFELARYFDVGVVLGGEGPEGSLRRATTDAGIPAIIYEAGGPSRFEAEEIARGIEGVTNVMEHLDMVAAEPPTPDPQRVYRSTTWVRANGGGIFLTDRAPGEFVHEGDLLGAITDPMTSERFEVHAPFAATLIGMAHPQIVLPGYGLFHLAQHEAGPTEPYEHDE